MTKRSFQLMAAPADVAVGLLEPQRGAGIDEAARLIRRNFSDAHPSGQDRPLRRVPTLAETPLDEGQIEPALSELPFLPHRKVRRFLARFTPAFLFFPVHSVCDIELV